LQDIREHRYSIHGTCLSRLSEAFYDPVSYT
jgi:hypothetical protein